MKRTITLIAVLLSVSAVASVGAAFFALTKKSPALNNQATTTININNDTTPTTNTNFVQPLVENTNTTVPAVNTTPTSPPTIVVPISDFFNRVTKKPFGIYITPATSPIQPEKFTGYHTGADAETTAVEATVDVPIFAIADGAVVFAGHVNGYGGVIMIRHKIDGVTITALYGHLRISSFAVKVGDPVRVDDKIGVLGTGYSAETDGERKHLHFGLVKGAVINYRGYVQTKAALSAWEDPVVVLKSHGGR